MELLRDFDNYNLSVFKNDPTVSPEILQKMVLDLKKQMLLCKWNSNLQQINSRKI